MRDRLDVLPEHSLDLLERDAAWSNEGWRVSREIDDRRLDAYLARTAIEHELHFRAKFARDMFCERRAHASELVRGGSGEAAPKAAK